MSSLWNENEKTAKRLLKNGHASMKDILALSFGEWPPRGLDISPAVPHTQQVTFKSFFRDAVRFKQHTGRLPTRFLKSLIKPMSVLADVLAVYGRASISGKRVIWINKFTTTFLPRFLGRSSIVPTLSHEGLHSLQGDNYYRAKDIFGAAGAGKIRQKQADMNCRMIMDDLDKHSHKFHKNILRRSFRAATRGASMRPGIRYLKDGAETQAFLHEALTGGYKKWNMMPRDKTDLWQALTSMGLKPPPTVGQHINSLPPESPSQVFRKKYHCEAGKNLKAIDRSLPAEAREHLWQTTLPMLYSDLIEMYGDRKGRERFGFGPNKKGQIQQLAFAAKGNA